MIRHLAFIAAIVAAGPASALSCAVSSVEQTYGLAAASPQNYVVVRGSLDLTGQSTPPEGAVALGGDINEMQGYTQPARLAGVVFTSGGFNQGWSEDVLVEVSCVAAWCGQAQAVDDGLFFIRQDANGTNALEVRACPRNVFWNPTSGDLQQVQTCFNSGTC